jgi:hypothetical protein
MDSSECIAFSWHKESAQFKSQLCELFPSLGEYIACASCVSGPKSCTCSRNTLCSLHYDFLLDFVLDVPLEEECQDMCAVNPECKWYTWYTRSFGQACALLRSCQDYKEVEDGSVKSGQADCSIQSVLPDACYDYSVLDSPTRNTRTPADGQCGQYGCCDKLGHSRATPDWNGPGWYRIMGEAGTKMPDAAPGEYQCGTAGSGWLSGGHPAVGDGAVNRTVYFHYNGNKYDSTDVQVLNCQAYYVYRFPDVPYCQYGYCGE